MFAWLVIASSLVAVPRSARHARPCAPKPAGLPTKEGAHVCACVCECECVRPYQCKCQLLPSRHHHGAVCGRRSIVVVGTRPALAERHVYRLWKGATGTTTDCVLLRTGVRTVHPCAVSVWESRHTCGVWWASSCATWKARGAARQVFARPCKQASQGPHLASHRPSRPWASGRHRGEVVLPRTSAANEW